MSQEAIIFTLCAYSLIQLGFFFFVVNKLVNKLMSRNYHEFQVAEKAGKPVHVPVTQPQEEWEEDLNHIA